MLDITFIWCCSFTDKIVDACLPVEEFVLSPRTTEINYSESPLTNGRYPNGTVASFTCAEGHVYHPDFGQNDITCEAPGEWSGDIPMCIG